MIVLGNNKKCVDFGDGCDAVCRMETAFAQRVSSYVGQPLGLGKWVASRISSIAAHTKPLLNFLLEDPRARADS